MAGILQFLKELFAPEEVSVVIPKQTVAFAELNAWLETHTNQNAKSISDAARPILDKIDDAIFANQANVNKLEHAELRNKNISSRELEIMKGNRQSYIKRTNMFLQQFSSLYDKENITYNDMKKLCEFYTAEIQVYHSATLKPYAVLQHFFANEAYVIAKNIKEIDDLMKQLQAIVQKQSVESITDIKEQVIRIQKKLERKAEIEAEKNTVEEEYVTMWELCQEAENKMNKLQSSEQYKRYLEVVAEAQGFQKKIEIHNASLVHSFSVVDKAVRKYAKTVPEKEPFLLSYLEKPGESLQTDSALEIASILATIMQQLDALDIKDDKKEKTLAELQVMTAAFFQQHTEYSVQLKEQKEQKEKICSSDTANQQFKEAEYMFKTYKEKAEALQKQCEEAVKDIEKQDVTADISQVQKDIIACTKLDVEIVL